MTAGGIEWLGVLWSLLTPHPLPPLPATLRCGGEGEKKKLKGTGEASCQPRCRQKLVRYSIRPNHSSIPIPLCFPISLQRGFASVAGRGGAA